MLSFDEDGLDETAPYGPQHSTPVKDKFGTSRPSVSFYPKGKQTVSQGKSSDRKEFCGSFDSPHNPVDRKMCQSDEKHNRNQCAHIAHHFIPESDVDISRIPPSEGSRAHLKSLSSNQCCPHPDNKVSSSTSRGQSIQAIANHGDQWEESKNCNNSDELFLKNCPHQCEIQRTPQNFHRGRVQSSSSRQSKVSSTPSHKSEVCCPCSVSRKNNNCPCQRVSDASLSARTSDCCSPKLLQSLGYGSSSYRKSDEDLRPECLSSSSSRQKVRSHSLPRTGYSGMNLCNNSSEVERSTLSIADITKTSAIFLDKDIIGKQREEIQLLMEELAGRDQELNDMVNSHQRQVRVWEADRDKLDSLQARLTKYEDELRSKEEELRMTLEEMARVQEQKEMDLSELGKTQADMVKLAERVTENSKYIHEIEIQNKTLSNSVKELLMDKKRLEEKERELRQQLDAKSADSGDQQATILKLREKVEALENQVTITEEKCQRKVQENETWRSKFFMEKDEAQKLAADCDSKDLTMAKMTQQLQESLQQAVALQKALFTSCEREKCKEEVLHSLRKQHKRTMQELKNIRELYDLQNRELMKQDSVLKDPLAAAQDKSARSSLAARDDFLDKASVIMDIRSARRKKRDKESSNSVLNEMSESHTDAQFDGDELLNTCHSHLTNVMASPNSELQEFNSNQRTLHSSKDPSYCVRPCDPQAHDAKEPDIDARHFSTRDKPHNISASTCVPKSSGSAYSHNKPQAQPPPTSYVHSRSQGQVLQQPHAHPSQPLLALDESNHQQQTTSDLSQYSTASATSIRKKETQRYRTISNPTLSEGPEKTQQSRSCSPELGNMPQSRSRSPELGHMSQPRSRSHEIGHMSQSRSRSHEIGHMSRHMSQSRSCSPELVHMSQSRNGSPELGHKSQSRNRSPELYHMSQSRNGSPELVHMSQSRSRSPELVHTSHARAPELSPRLSMERRETERQMSKARTYHNQLQHGQCSPSNKSSNPELGSRPEETRYRERSKGSPHARRIPVDCPSGDHYGGKRDETHLKELNTGGTKKSPYLYRKAEHCFVEPVEAPKQRLNVRAETQEKSKAQGLHPNVATAQDSVGSFTSRKTDSTLIPHQSHKTLNKDTELPSQNLKKTIGLSGEERTPPTEEFRKTNDGTNTVKKCSMIRQGSYVIDKHNEKRNQETARHAHHENSIMTISRPNSSLRESRVVDTPSVGKENQWEREQRDSGRCTPAHYPSTSDVSHVPFDDELTPADSDGMCQELKRDFQKMCHEQSPGAKVIYSNYPAEPRDDGHKKVAVSVNSQTPLNPASQDDGEEEKSQGKSKKSQERETMRTARASDCHYKEPCRKDSAGHDVSPYGRSHSHHSREKDAIDLSTKNSGLETNDDRSSNSPSHKVKYSKLDQSEKAYYRKRMQHAADNKGKDSVTMKQLQGGSSRQSECSSPEVIKDKRKRDKSSGERESKGHRKHKGESSHKSVKNENLSLERTAEEAAEEVAHCMTDYKLKEELVHNPKVSSKDKHPCVSPIPSKTSKKYILTDTPINTVAGNKASFCYSPGQYGSCDLSRDTRYSSRPLQGVGLGLGTSSSRPTSFALSSNTQPRKGSYSSFSASTKSYSSRSNFLPGGVGTYLSSRLSAWYKSSGSGNYALNNNNEIYDDEGTTREVCDNDGEYVENSRSEDLRHLNTNNNNDVNIEVVEFSNIMDSSCEVNQFEEANWDNAQDNVNNNNNLRPVCVSDIFFEEILSSDNYNNTSEENPSDFKETKEIAHEEFLISQENQCTVGTTCTTKTDSMASKPFITRGPSLYRQLAQIHFSEKTRRYEWVVPPCTSEIQQDATSPHGVEFENDSELSTGTSKQILGEKNNLENEQMLIPHGERFDSKSAVESHCVAAPSRASHQCELGTKAGISTNITHCDSGLYSMSSHEGLHISTLKYQKSMDGWQPLPPSHHQDIFNGKCYEPYQTHLADSFKDVPFSLNHSQNQNRSNCSCVNSSVAPQKIPAVIPPNSVTVTNTCHRGSMDSTSPTASMLDSFMGVAAAAACQVAPRDVSSNHRDTREGDNHSHPAKQSSSLDGVVKKLDFDDTSLDVTAIDIVDNPGEINNNGIKMLVGLESDAGSPKLDSGFDCNNHNHVLHFNGLGKPSVMVEESSLTTNMPNDSSSQPFNTSYNNKENSRVDNRGDFKGVNCKTRPDLSITHTHKDYNRECDASDVLSQPSLSEYFQDISSVLVEPDCVSHHEEGVVSDHNNLQTKSIYPENLQDMKQADVEMKTKTVDGLGHKLHYVFDAQTLRYMSFLTTDNETKKDVIHQGNMDEGIDCTEKVSRLKSSDCGETVSFENEISGNGHHEPENTDALLKPCKIWREQSVEEVAVHFDDKLSSFLEEKDLVDTTRKFLQGSTPAMSPSSKLQHLLLESQHLIWALERSSAVPEALSSRVTHY